jgi:hypothetical protein
MPKVPKVSKVKVALRANYLFSSKKVSRRRRATTLGTLGTSNFRHFIAISLKRLEGSER